MSDADNSFIGIEHLTDVELEAILDRCEGEARKLHEERRRRGKQILARAGASRDAKDPEKVMAAVSKAEKDDAARAVARSKPAARKTAAKAAKPRSKAKAA